MTDTYSIYEAKARLSEIIRAIKRNRRVTITERGVPVAEVVPYGSSQAPSFETRIAQLESTGNLAPARRGVEAIGPIARRPGGLERFLAERE